MLQQAVASYMRPITGTNMTDIEAWVMFHRTTKEFEQTIILIWFISILR